ncbi:hypothetical protein RAH57_13995 [Chryseobacterium sp. CKR4-1]|uniref:hypothetical protein n=1 Tax=Chryseobacterium sp. CKR4-1 TaxID=3068896 RepID=UPI0027969952|nr:hypothetical protein [Chryseobacterium sp. CKR4-1]MDQ1805105.1 hypothetical protein [Chryseobacterium sp. CKR4-1]
MRNILSITLILASQSAFTQVIIGNASGTAQNKTSVLLEFAQGQNKGIVLPYTRTLPTSPVEGTILLDATTASDARVKFYNGSWTDLSGQGANVASALASQPTSSQAVENTDEKVVIGNPVSAAEGVLVLESESKAMILPYVDNTDDIPNPAPGMMVYINKTGAKRLAVFNGSKWSYWKP